MGLCSKLVWMGQGLALVLKGLGQVVVAVWMNPFPPVLLLLPMDLHVGISAFDLVKHSDN